MGAWLFVVAAALACAPAGQGASELGAREEGAALLERIRLFDASVDPVNRLSGVLLIARGDALLVHEAFGMADQEHGVPNALDTRFCIASITKEMTRLVVWELLVEGELELATPLSAFVPDFPRGDEITVEHLMSFRAGLPARVTKPSETWRRMSAEQVTERARSAELLFEPGSQSVYSSATYTVLARVVELVEKRSFGEVLRRRVFEPAGMKDTLDPDARQLVPRRARAYVPGRDALLNAPLQDLSFLAGAGSVVSTAADLLRFLRAYQRGTFHAQAWASTQGGPAVHWTGASNGFHAFVEHDPATDTTVVFAGNSYGRAAGELRAALPRLFAGEEVLASARPATLALDPELLARYTGLYQTRPGSFWPVEVIDGELVMSDSVALPLSETEFWFQPWNSRMRFVRESDGGAWRLHPEGGEPWPRVGDAE